MTTELQIARFAATFPLVAYFIFATTACDDNRPHGDGSSTGTGPGNTKISTAVRGESRIGLRDALSKAEKTPASRYQIYLNLLNAGIPPGDAKLVFNSILSNVGPGQDRDDLLQAFFFNSISSIKDDLTLLRDSNLTKSESDRAYLGLACRIGIRGDSTLLDELASIGDGLSEREIYTLASGLSFRVDQAFSARIFGYESSFTEATQADKNQQFNDAYLILSSILAGQKPEVASAAFSNFIDNAARSAPFEAWKKFSDLADLHPEIPESRAIYQGIVANMARHDPELALKILANSESGQIVPNSRTAFDSWLKKDATAAFDWLKKEGAGLSSEQLDGCNAALANYHIQSNDSREARRIASSISHTELRSKVEGQIWGLERTSLRNEVAKDPVGTIQGIVSGQSKYSDYWIEEAMTTWISKEPGKAEQWYQKNWASLPPAKSQYVAAAYAKDALAHGDTITARQWLQHIQDAKLKERIETLVTKAATAGAN